MYLLYIYFIFKSTKILPYFAASNQHFTGMPEDIKNMILNTLQVYTTKIMYTTLVYFTIYPFLVFYVCVLVNALPEKYSIFIFKSVYL